MTKQRNPRPALQPDLFHPPQILPPVVNATVANPAAHDSTAGTPAARTPRKTARLRHRKGGVR